MKSRHKPTTHDDVDSTLRRLFEVDEELARQSTVGTASTQPGASVQPMEDEEGSAAERYLHWIEALRLTSPELVAEAFTDSASSAKAVAGIEGNAQGTASEPLDIGTSQIGRFRLERKLGSGGYGIVFLAHDPNLNRQVALKVPRPEVLVTRDLRRRFLREAEAAASLDHPHIVPVYEAGSAGPICFIAAAFCDGWPLNQWLERRGGNVLPRLAARLIEELAGAVQHAHERGILHRDIKPGNILIEAVDEADDNAAVEGVRLTDFGLARIGYDASDQTTSAAIVGTPAYMAPEQATSEHARVGVPTDVYALGATLYHLLTGRPPIVGASPMATLSAIARTNPIEPARLVPAVPRDLNAICLKCLEKSPERRYPSAADLRADLQRFLDGETVVARPVGRIQRLAKWCHRNPKLAGLSITAMIALLATVTTATVGWWSTSLALATAERRYWETKDAVDNYFIAISENQLLSAPGLKPLRGELLGTALEYYLGFLEQNKDDPDLLDEVRAAHVRVGQIYQELGKIPDARLAFDQALGLVDRCLATDPKDPALRLKKGMILRKLAVVDRRSGRSAKAMNRIEEAMDIHRQLADASYEVDKNAEQLGLLLSNKASVIHQQGDVPGAEQVFQESEEIFQRLATKFPNEPRWRFLHAQSRGNRSIMQRMMGRLVDSRALLEEAIDIYRGLVDAHPENHSYQLNLGKALANLSTYATMNRNYDVSLDVLQQATEVFDRLASIDPQVSSYQALRASTRNEAGMLEMELRHYDEAEKLFSKSLEIIEKVLEANPEDQKHRGLRNQIYLSLGKVDLHRGHEAEAMQYLNKAVADYDDVKQPAHRDARSQIELADCLNQRAKILNRQNKPNEALQNLTRAHATLDTLQSQLPANSVLRKYDVANRVATADALELLQRFEEALTHRDEVVRVADEPLQNRRRLERATTLARAGQAPLAEAIIAEAQEPTHPDEWVILARAHAVLAADTSGRRAALERHQQAALAALREAASLGLNWSESEYPPNHPDWSSLPANDS